MSVWRKKAMEFLPELRQTIQEAETVNQLWSELYLEFADAYGNAQIVGSRISHDPNDEKKIVSIYTYAEWCFLRSHNQEIHSSAVGIFYESLGINLYARDEMPKYVTPEVFKALCEANILEYFLKSDEYDKFIENYWNYQKTKMSGNKFGY